MDILTLVLFIAGLGCLVSGAEWLVKGACGLATTVGISPLIIGLTVVAFGTSAPELAVSLQSALNDRADIALGNVVGSNIANVLLILGLCALITPLTVAQQLVRLDVPLMIGVSVLLYLLALDGRVGRWDGLLLFAGIVAYTIWCIRTGRQESTEIIKEYEQEFAPPKALRPVAYHIGWFIIGLVALVIGARWLVDGAVVLARWVGIGELVIGLTIVAVGTSLPEIATSVIAGLRGERDIAVGNAIGSNLFNILSVLGATALLSPTGVTVAPAALHFDIPVMIAVAMACFPIFFTGYRIDRWEGGLFLFYYVTYTTYLILYATAHRALAPFNTVMLWFVLPLTIITLVVLMVPAWSRSPAQN